MSDAKLNWRFIDGDGLPDIGVIVLAYRPNARARNIMGSDVRLAEYDGAFAHTRSDAPVIAWVPVAELMETLP